MIDPAKIRAARRRLRLTQPQAGARAGISPQRWCEIEHGRRIGQMQLGIASKIAQALEMPLADLMADDTEAR